MNTTVRKTVIRGCDSRLGLKMEEKPDLVMALVKNQGKMLVIERANKEPGTTWAFPGGEIESGEMPGHTAIREVYEETGVKCEAIRQIYERIHPVTGIKILYWECHPKTTTIKITETDEIANAEWVDPEEIINKRFTSDPAPEVKQFMLGK